MNQKEFERLEKDSIYTLKISNDLKDSVIQANLNELNRALKTNMKKNELVVFVMTV